MSIDVIERLSSASLPIIVFHLAMQSLALIRARAELMIHIGR